ncbi:DUF1499 domain-containing protein [Falsiroseomonas selenitidurans]|uniref:DUF1499 domain-containing protein n=1 Tax=Falsiroseomonas selenitidurans TaxID=2716335 RepID=A0ABX1E0V6_9PROT|nr:DUF1499 domain-containing protein [Falsiroseomonas selenitidurans]NKC30300.1 DUF1499 domain-containing protein [Falsiroseomonas selenitidurans]
MSTLDLLRGRGPAGLPPPVPVDFEHLVLPPSPNAHLAAPPGVTNERHETIPLLPISPEAAWAALRMAGEGVPRCWKLAEWPDRRQVQWVVRTRFANFPDILAGQVVPLPGGSGFFLFSRSLIGWSDFGVNRRRVAAWRARLDEALRAG